MLFALPASGLKSQFGESVRPGSPLQFPSPFYNPETEEVKLIDFGKSCDFDDIEDNMDDINKFLNTETYLSSVDELVKYERDMFLLDI